MKKIKLVLSSFLLVVVMNSCHDKYTESYQANVPVYMDIEDWRAQDISVESPKIITEAGKIYIYQDYLFVVDPGLGVHIVNNANPSSPQNTGFLPVQGCLDVAVRNNSLYVDSYFDLLSFSLSDPSNPTLSCRVTDAFDSNFLPMGPGYDESLPVVGVNSENGIIVGWTQQEISVDSEEWQNLSNDMLSPSESIATGNPANFNSVSVGVGGSMAQFTITGNYLYVLRPSSITSFNLDADICPEQSSVTSVSWQAETIFPYNNHLFLGTTSGMMIFHLNNPATPEFVSSISHLTACDPVVVQNDRAYVTIRSGNSCWGTLNQLLVIDVSNYSTPSTIAEYNLTNPHGLGIDGNTLFVCDGSAGLKVFDAADDLNIIDNMISQYDDIDTYDVIPYNDVLIMSSEEGIYQYDYSDPHNIFQLSFMPVN
ncbi:MAG TPA: hypothetical protein VJ911_03380 [Cryomorphaceae bacterium]|nr:hypothetical protein [Cryomorphaceae bacterium]